MTSNSKRNMEPYYGLYTICSIPSGKYSYFNKFGISPNGYGIIGSRRRIQTLPKRYMTTHEKNKGRLLLVFSSWNYGLLAISFRPL